MTAPGYWIHETTGVLRPAVIAYFHGCMTPEHIAALRAYLRQWIGAPVWDANPHMGEVERAWLAAMRAAVDELTTREAIAAWCGNQWRARPAVKEEGRP
jgi:hypothetical protein